MDIKTLIKKANLSPKEKAVLNYLHTYEAVDNAGEITFNTDDFENKGVLSQREYERIMEFEDRLELYQYYKWCDLIAILLSYDMTAQKLYYHIAYLISSSMLKNTFEKNIDKIRNICFIFFIYTYSVSLINHLFNNLPYPDSLKLLEHLLLFEDDIDEKLNKTGEENNKSFFANVYKEKRNEVKRIARTSLKEIVYSMKEFEYISESMIERYVDETDQFFTDALFFT